MPGWLLLQPLRTYHLPLPLPAGRQLLLLHRQSLGQTHHLLLPLSGHLLLVHRQRLRKTHHLLVPLPAGHHLLLEHRQVTFFLCIVSVFGRLIIFLCHCQQGIIFFLCIVSLIIFFCYCQVTFFLCIVSVFGRLI